MAIDDASLTTLLSRPLQPVRTGSGVPALTIGFHPDTSRVGERALLSGFDRPLGISRNEPEFFGSAGPEGRALAEPHLSRRAVVLSRCDGGVRLDRGQTSTTLAVDGVPIEAHCTVDDDRLDAGVVLELGDRVVLILHRSTRVAVDSPLGGLVGVSDEMAQLRTEIRNVAPQPVPVLLLGESGVGKELAARALHDSSPRHAGPYVTLNMAAIVASTAASELFGHEAGAFTGAARRHDGCFVEADEGTLFLDEIGTTSSDVQAMLLRVLETGELRAVGARSSRSVDVRVIAATDRDLDQATANGEFRLPLLHRLAVYPITIPPLRHRRCDIGPLLLHFLREELGEADAPRLLDAEAGESPQWLQARIVAQLARLPWPGNVRELRNTVRQLVIANRGEPVVVLSASLERRLDVASGDPVGERLRGGPAQAKPARARADLDSFSDEQVLTALRNNQFKVAATARELGVSKHSMYQLMERSDSIRIAKDLTADEIREVQTSCGNDLAEMARGLEVSKRGLRLRMTDLGIGDLGDD